MNPVVRGILLILFGIAIAFSFLSFFSAKDVPAEEKATSAVNSKLLYVKNFNEVSFITIAAEKAI